MDTLKSTDLVAPFFGPQNPFYPELPQVLRVSGGAIAGNVYPAFNTQRNGLALELRDREASYVWEPNGIVLQAGYYDCRLIGSHLGLPLYATTCCPVSASSASASSGLASPVSAAAGSGAYRVPLGKVSSGTTTGTVSTAIPRRAVPAGLLRVNALIASTDLAATISAMTFGGTSMGASVVGVNHPDLTNGMQFGIATYFLAVASPTIGDITGTTVTAAGKVSLLLMTAEAIVGLSSNILDRIQSNFGSATIPDTGATAATAFGSEYAGAAFGYPGSAGVTWGGSFTKGQSISASLNPPLGLGVVWGLSDGYRLNVPQGSAVQAVLSAAIAKWCGSVSTAA